MGQKCCTEIPEHDFKNRKLVKPNSNPISQHVPDQLENANIPILNSPVHSTLEELGEFTPQYQHYERGTEGNPKIVNTDGTVYSG